MWVHSNIKICRGLLTVTIDASTPYHSLPKPSWKQDSGHILRKLQHKVQKLHWKPTNFVVVDVHREESKEGTSGLDL